MPARLVSCRASAFTSWRVLGRRWNALLGPLPSPDSTCTGDLDLLSLQQQQHHHHHHHLLMPAPVGLLYSCIYPEALQHADVLSLFTKKKQSHRARATTLRRTAVAVAVWIMLCRDADNKQLVHFYVGCSKGTYIRTLGHDLATSLGSTGGGRVQGFRVGGLS
jgi:hypothetical protein